MSLFIQEGGRLIQMLTFRFHFTHQFWTQWPKLDYITYLMKLEQSLSLKFLSPDINLLSMYGFCLPWIYLIVYPYLVIVIAFIMKNCRGVAISKYHPSYWKVLIAMKIIQNPSIIVVCQSSFALEPWWMIKSLWWTLSCHFFQLASIIHGSLCM